MDKNGLRKDSKFELQNVENDVLLHLKDAVSDGVARVEKATFEFILQKTFMEKKMAVILFQNDKPRNNLVGYRSVAIQERYKDIFDFYYFDGEPSEIPQMKLNGPKNIFIFIPQETED